MPARSHYDVLGVARGASGEEVRRAYLHLARELHPDRFSDAGSERRADVERQMREVNEAWRVLGNTGRRLQYDLELDRLAGVHRSTSARQWDEDRWFTSRTDGTMPPDVDLDDVDVAARAIRGLPWLLLIVVLGAIFVFTAYAVTGGRTSTTPGSPSPACVTVSASGVATGAPCGSPAARRVVVQVSSSQPCPSSTERFQPAVGGNALCLEV
jgi:DnaJ domain